MVQAEGLSREVDRDSLVGIATCYGLDGPVSEGRRGTKYLHPSRLGLEPIQPPVLYNGH